jgi:hypothetical protein
MTTVTSQARIEQVLVEATSLLVERARQELEGDAEAGDKVQRLRALESELNVIREELTRAHTPVGRQVSRFYEVPGQEDG